MKAINVVHDGPVTRARNIEQWAGPHPSMGGKDYYTWAEVEYHPFIPTIERGRVDPNYALSDYERGYQAGYHAAMRAAKRLTA